MKKIVKEFHNLGDFLKNYRVKNDLTLAELSELTQVSESFLNRIENKDRRNITMDVFLMISYGMDKDPSDLLRTLTNNGEDEDNELQYIK